MSKALPNNSIFFSFAVVIFSNKFLKLQLNLKNLISKPELSLSRKDTLTNSNINSSLETNC